MPGYSIAHKELIPIVTGALIWGSSWYGKTVQFISDNEAVVVVLNGLYARDEKIMHMLRCLLFVAAHFNFWLTATHIAGRDNTLADALSRNNMSRFYSQAPRAINPSPSRIPSEIPHLLFVNPPDWLSPSWMALFAMQFYSAGLAPLH